MKKVLSLLIACTLFFLFLGPLLAEDVPEDQPEWLKRVEYSIEIESDKHPTFYFQTVQPLHQSLDKTHTVFIQPRLSLKAGDLTYNLGFGYRNFLSDNLLLGVNLFGDFEDLHEHGRLGCGFEALGQILEYRLNTYFGVTSKRVVEESATSTIYERVASGYDSELGAPIPYLPWLKLYGSGFWYDFKKSNNKFGWKSRLEARLNDAVRLEWYTWDDNKGEQEYGARIRFNFAFDKLTDFKKVFMFSKEPFPKKDLKEQVLIPVERNFDIVTERWIESGTMTISVGRHN